MGALGVPVVGGVSLRSGFGSVPRRKGHRLGRAPVADLRGGKRGAVVLQWGGLQTDCALGGLWYDCVVINADYVWGYAEGALIVAQLVWSRFERTAHFGQTHERIEPDVCVEVHEKPFSTDQRHNCVVAILGHGIIHIIIEKSKDLGNKRGE